jgi:hypothetical protein
MTETIQLVIEDLPPRRARVFSPRRGGEPCAKPLAYAGGGRPPCHEGVPRLYRVVSDSLQKAVELFATHEEAEAIVQAWDRDEPEQVGALRVERLF